MSSSSKNLLLAAGLLSACLAPVAAQTWSACNPMNVTTCTDNPALGMTYNYDFTNANNASTWNATAGTVNYGSQGGQFTINKRHESPTIQSEFYIMFGVVEVHMQAAKGQGIISSIVLESDDLDEVDWEMMGGNNTHVETNYFGKGNTTLFNRAIYYPVSKPLETFHNYTVHWTKDVIEWYIDTALVRTLHYGDALGGYNFPQTPMNIRLGIWAGGDSSNSNGTIEWAGGLTDFSKAPFTMIVQSIKVQDYGTGKAYHWSDKSGSFSSIKSVSGNSTAATTLTSPANATTSSAASSSAAATSSSSISQKWNSLSSGTRIGIYSGAGVFAAALAGLITFFCIKQRRAGRKEQAAYAAQQEKNREEAEAFQNVSKSPDALPSSATPDEFNHGGVTYEKPGQFGSNGSAVRSPPSGFAGLSNVPPRSTSGNAPLNGPPSGPPNGPLPDFPLNGPNNSRSPVGNGPPGGQDFQGGAYGANAARMGNGPGSMRSNNSFNDPRGFSNSRSPSNGPGSSRGYQPNNFGDGPPRLGTPGSMRSFSDSRSVSGQNPPSPRDFTSGNGFSAGNGNGPPRMGHGPPSARNNGPGGFGGFPGGNNSGNYGDGGLRSPNLPIGYADGGSRSPSNFSHPGFASPRAQSPRVPLVQSPRDYYAPGPAQFGGSSGGNYFSNNPGNGYSRPGAF